MATVNDVLRTLENFAPPRLKMDFDKCGAAGGPFREMAVDRVLVALDITDAVIEEALRRKKRSSSCPTTRCSSP